VNWILYRRLPPEKQAALRLRLYYNLFVWRPNSRGRTRDWSRAQDGTVPNLPPNKL
jgi:hypothetical protein